MESAVREGNLTTDTQKPRFQAGVAALSVGLVMAAVMLDHGASVPVRLLLFLPFLVSSHLLLMGLFNTCSGLAARGMRDVGDGPETIANQEELRAVRALARRVSRLSLAVAVVATALFVWMP